jgi:hypothetical protein
MLMSLVRHRHLKSKSIGAREKERRLGEYIAKISWLTT